MKDFEEYDDCECGCGHDHELCDHDREHCDHDHEHCDHDHEHCDHDHEHCGCGHHHNEADDAVALDERQVRARLLNIVAISNNYCVALEHAGETETESEDNGRSEFVVEILDYLPRIYWEFSDLQTAPAIEEETYLPQYVDEDYYESIRRRVGAVMGEEDTFLETFEEDMKYSDSPIAASISESLADIFQNLYDFVAAVRESDGDLLIEAFAACKDNFIATWSQTLCNVLRALNHLRYNKL